MMPSRAYLMRRGLPSSSTLRHCWGDQVCTTKTGMETGLGGGREVFDIYTPLLVCDLYRNHT